jgi:hypothetical protein
MFVAEHSKLVRIRLRLDQTILLIFSIYVLEQFFDLINRCLVTLVILATDAEMKGLL